MNYLNGALTCVLLSLSCSAVSSSRETDAERLARWMTGSFSSEDQALASPDDYFDIHLETVSIWTSRTDGPWLYVEQAAASALERPYRQRVYHLVDTAEGVRSDVYELPGDPLALAGAWRMPERFDDIDPSQLSLRAGCSIHLVAESSAYLGATRGEGCVSTLGGASYATSEVSIEQDVLSSWDRGYYADGTQAWGATLGPYVFVRQ